MLLFPGRVGLEIVAYLKIAEPADRRTPRKPSDDLAAIGERVEVDAMLHRPAILKRTGEHGMCVGDVGVLEREFANAEAGQHLDVSVDGGHSVDRAAGHHARRPHFEPRCRPEESREIRCRRPHQVATSSVIVMMARIAQVRQAGVAQPAAEVRRQECAVRETGDLGEMRPAPLDDPDDVVGSQQRFAAAGDDEPGRAASREKAKYASRSTALQSIVSPSRALIDDREKQNGHVRLHARRTGSTLHVRNRHDCQAASDDSDSRRSSVAAVMFAPVRARLGGVRDVRTAGDARRCTNPIR